VFGVLAFGHEGRAPTVTRQVALPMGLQVTIDNNVSTHRHPGEAPLFSAAAAPAGGPLNAPNARPKTMALTLQDVSRIAHLARLELSAPEQALMLEQLNGFFGIVEQMSAVDTRGVEPLYTPLSAVQAVELRLRDDAITEVDQRQANQRSAPAVEDGLFLVPKVIE
jgi:aspartyl-tRNA(Asn)/glutamyl-tRNA(Gln) amidotransferase subunit C